MPKHRSPGLSVIYNEFRTDKGIKRVLDLGPMRANNFNFFSALKCNVHFENLNEFIADFGQSDPQIATTQLQQFLLSQFNKKKFNLILAWDFFNYLTIDTLKSFLEFIQPHCEDDCLLHLLSYTHKTIPASPANYSIENEHYINFKDYKVTPRTTPAIATYSLLKNTPGYLMQLSLVNKDGMYPGTAEYLLQYSPNSNKLTKKAELKSDIEKNNNYDHLPKHVSPSLKTIDYSKEKTVLDLGPTNSHNASWLAKKFGEVYSENIIMAVKPNADSNQYFRSSLFNFDNNICFDYVFCWDILNFLSFEQLQELFERLRPFVNNQSILIGLMYNSTSAPQAPRHYRFIDKHTVALARSNLQNIQFHTHNAFNLSKAANGLNIKHTYLFQANMQPGITEQVFSLSKMVN